MVEWCEVDCGTGGKYEKAGDVLKGVTVRHVYCPIDVQDVFTIRASCDRP
jgi:hypothetical protein